MISEGFSRNPNADPIEAVTSAPPPKLKLLDRVRDEIRRRNMSLGTEASVSESASEVEGEEMSFGHERLDGYRAALEYGWHGYATRDESARYAAAPGVDADTDSDSEERAGANGRTKVYSGRAIKMRAAESWCSAAQGSDFPL